MKRRQLLRQLADVARIYGVGFDHDRPAHGGAHDRFAVGRYFVEVPRHRELNEYTARGILRNFENICNVVSKEDG
jgi:mRNA interferase HicA